MTAPPFSMKKLRFKETSMDRLRRILNDFFLNTRYIFADTLYVSRDPDLYAVYVMGDNVTTYGTLNLNNTVDLLNPGITITPETATGVQFQLRTNTAPSAAYFTIGTTALQDAQMQWTDSGGLAISIDPNNATFTLDNSFTVVASNDISLVAVSDLSLSGTTVTITGPMTFNGGVVFNEPGADVDFRVESDTNTHMLFLDASAETVLVGTSTDLTSTLGVKISADADKGIVVRANSGTQSGSLQEWQSSGGTALITFGPTGKGGFNTAIHADYMFDFRGATNVARFYSDSTSSSDIVFEFATNGGTNRDFVIRGNGAFGFGVSSPGTKFHFKGTADLVKIEHTTAAAGDLVIWYLGSATNLFGLRGDGDLACGHVSPSAQVDIRNDTDAEPGLIVRNSSSQSTNIAEFQANGGGVNISFHQSGGAVFNEQGNDTDVRIEGDGDANLFFTDASTDRVGIGTNSPGAKLDVRGSVIINEDGSDVDVRIEGDTDANLVFTDASADKVGIGTASPAEKLHVVGHVKLNRLKQDLGTSIQTSDVALSAGWGASAAVTAVSGNDSRGTITVTTNAADTPTANPTATLTFKDLTWTSAPFATANIVGTSTGPLAAVAVATTATTLILTYIGTPTATSALTYVFSYSVKG